MRIKVRIVSSPFIPFIYSLNTSVVLISIISLGLGNTGSAQALSGPQKQVPTNQAAIKEQTEFLTKNVPAAPLPAGSDKLDFMRKRAKALQEKHTAYAKGIASGKIDPYAHLRNARPQHQREILRLRDSLTAMADENASTKLEVLSKAFFAALQPVGPLLENAYAGKGYANILSKKQQAELARLEKAWDETDGSHRAGAKPLVITGPGQLFTVTRLSVPVIVQAPPASKVLFQTFGGGFFSNKLALIEVEANAAGIAKAEWVTYGGSIGDTVISVLSKSAAPAPDLIITTVQLKLVPLPELPKLPKRAPVAPELIPRNK